VKQLLKSLLPPVCADAYNTPPRHESGCFAGYHGAWSGAEHAATRKNAPVVRAAIHKMRDNEAVFERDSRLLPCPELQLPLLTESLIYPRGSTCRQRDSSP